MSIDETSKKATMGHMNRDHALDLGLYLRFVNGLSADELAAAGHPQLVDMDLASLHIRTAVSGTVHVVPLEPPMAAWGERRARLIALAMDARRALGVALPEHADHAEKPKPVDFVPPAGWDVAVFGAVVLFAAVSAMVWTGHDDTATSLWTAVTGALGATPANFVFAGADGFRRMVWLMMAPVLGIHLAECWWMDRTRLATHGVARFSRPWCLWLGSTFWEGAMAFRRFDRAVKAKHQ